MTRSDLQGLKGDRGPSIEHRRGRERPAPQRPVTLPKASTLTLSGGVPGVPGERDGGPRVPRGDTGRVPPAGISTGGWI